MLWALWAMALNWSAERLNILSKKLLGMLCDWTKAAPWYSLITRVHGLGHFSKL